MLAFPWISAWTHWGKRARWSCLRGWTCTWLYRRWRDFVFSPGIFMIFFSLYYSLPHSQVGSNATPKPFRDRRWSAFNCARCERIHLFARGANPFYTFTSTASRVSFSRKPRHRCPTNPTHQPPLPEFIYICRSVRHPRHRLLRRLRSTNRKFSGDWRGIFPPNFPIRLRAIR